MKRVVTWVNNTCNPCLFMHSLYNLPTPAACRFCPRWLIAYCYSFWSRRGTIEIILPYEENLQSVTIATMHASSKRYRQIARFCRLYRETKFWWAILALKHVHDSFDLRWTLAFLMHNSGASGGVGSSAVRLRWSKREQRWRRRGILEEQRSSAFYTMSFA